MQPEQLGAVFLGAVSWRREALRAASASGLLEPGMELMAKPFVMDALAARIRAMMEAR